jgi:hypothetical protein
MMAWIVRQNLFYCKPAGQKVRGKKKIAYSLGVMKKDCHGKVFKGD